MRYDCIFVVCHDWMATITSLMIPIIVIPIHEERNGYTIARRATQRNSHFSITGCNNLLIICQVVMRKLRRKLNNFSKALCIVI